MARRCCCRIRMRASACGARGRTGSCSRGRRCPATPLASWVIDRASGRVVSQSPPGSIRRLEDTAAIKLALADPKVADWLRRYKAHTQYATYEPTLHTWTVHVNAGQPYGEVAQVEVDDRTGKVNTPGRGRR